MQVNPIMSNNTNSTNLNQVNFKRATINPNVKEFMEQQVKIELEYIRKCNRKPMTKKQEKSCISNLRACWDKAYSELEEKANQMSDGIEISVSKTERNIFDMLLAKNKEKDKSADLVALIELKGFESHTIGRNKFQLLVESIDPKRISEKLDPNASSHRLDKRW